MTVAFTERRAEGLPIKATLLLPVSLKTGDHPAET
jgi:hypothetical protein